MISYSRIALNREPAISGGHLPRSYQLASVHDGYFLMQSTCGADMSWNSQQHISRNIPLSFWRFQNQMFFVMNHLHGIRKVGKVNSLTFRRIGSNGLISQIQRDAIVGRPTYHTSHDDSCGREVQIGKVGTITSIVKDACPGTQHNGRLIKLCVNRKRWLTTTQQLGHTNSAFFAALF